MPLVFERSRAGRKGTSYSPTGSKLPAGLQRGVAAELPEVSELDVVRHYTTLSRLNFSVDTNFYPLGSCTMKYNPRINEEAASYSGFSEIHPYQDDDTAQGSLELMYELQEMLLAITGMDAITLQPAAGAHGELAGILMIRAYHESQGKARKKVLIPDSAHGTNPASSTIAGYEVVEIKTGKEGILTLDALDGVLDEDVAALMLTNPNTLGIFEKNIEAICRRVHAKGGLVYCDGANLNALMGQALIGDMGVDVLHINLHKTFSTPHGGGGPGSGPVAVKKNLEPFLPVPRIIKATDPAKNHNSPQPPLILRGGGKEIPPLNIRGGQGGLQTSYQWSYDHPHSIGRMQSFYGNFGVLVRAYAYIRQMGDEGLKKASELAVLNANYIKARLKDSYDLPYNQPTLHEVVFSEKKGRHDVRTLDIAKRLLDYGFHPPTIYFPLIVSGAIMIEPTETESKETLDAFCDAMLAIAREAEENPEIVRGAPHTTPVGRLNEAQAVRNPKLRY